MNSPTLAAFVIASRSIIFIVASAAAIDIGFPPNVDACDPGFQSMISARVIQIPSGIPLAMPFAIQTMSGSTPDSSMAHHFPVRPHPHCTSSATSKIPCRSQMALSSRRKFVGAGTNPPSP